MAFQNHRHRYPNQKSRVKRKGDKREEMRKKRKKNERTRSSSSFRSMRSKEGVDSSQFVSTSSESGAAPPSTGASWVSAILVVARRTAPRGCSKGRGSDVQRPVYEK